MEQMTKGIFAKMQQQEHVKEINEKTNGLVATTVELATKNEELSGKNETLEEANKRLTQANAELLQQVDMLTLRNSQLITERNELKQKLDGPQEVTIV